jgi:micrococcal nuclease
VERTTIIFWALVSLLLGMSAFYGVNAWRFTAANQQKDAVLASGDVVRLVNVLDGDTLVVAKEGQGNTTVRLLGIKTFESKHGKDEAAMHGRAAEEAVKRVIGENPLRVLLNNPPKDRHGRTLANLYIGGEDIGLALVAQGHALVYTVYPFANMPVYLQAQTAARKQQLGLWGDSTVVERAEGLIREWARQAP